MRAKKAVLLVLNNKTKGSVLSTNGVHAVLNPVKRKGSVLSEGELVVNLNPAFTDIVTSPDVLTTALFYNRSFFSDASNEIEVINITFSKAFNENIASTDRIVLAQGLGILDDTLKDEQLQKNVIKVFGDVQAQVERITLSLSKTNIDNVSLNEVFSKVFQKALQEVDASSDIIVLTSSKSFSELTQTFDNNVLVFGKSNQEIVDYIESTIFNAAKALSDDNQIVEQHSKSVSKPFTDEFAIQDTSALNPQKQQSELVTYFDAAVNSVTKAIEEVSLVAESLAFDISKILFDSPELIDTPQKTLSKVTSDFFALIDSIIVTLLKERFVFDSVSYDEFNIKTFTKGLEDAGVIVEKLEFDFSTSKSDNNNIDDQLSNFLTKVLGTDDVVITDTFEKTIGKYFDNDNLLSESTIKTVAKALQEDSLILELLVKTFAKALPNETVSFSDTIEKLLVQNRFINENDTQDYTEDNTYFLEDYVRSGISVKHIDSMIRTVTKGLQDVQTTQDVISILLNVIETLSDAFSVSDDSVLDFNKRILDIINASESTSKEISSNSSIDFPEAIDIPAFENNKVLSDSFEVQDSILVNISLVQLLQDLISHLSNTIKSFTKGVEEAVDTSETFTKNVQTTLSESIQLLDLINIVLIEVGRFSDEYQSSSSGRLVSQNYVESAGYDSETYFLEDYLETLGLYFLEDYVGESRILT